MRVLCVCKMGRNRSRYLAEYLGEQGHETRYVGISKYAREQVSQEHIDWADVIIAVRESIREEVIIRHNIVDKRTIALNVHDNPFLIGPSALTCKVLSPASYQEEHVYCRLREQLAPHLPLVPSQRTPPRVTKVFKATKATKATAQPPLPAAG